MNVFLHQQSSSNVVERLFRGHLMSTTGIVDLPGTETIAQGLDNSMAAMTDPIIWQEAKANARPHDQCFINTIDRLMSSQDTPVVGVSGMQHKPTEVLRS